MALTLACALVCALSGRVAAQPADALKKAQAAFDQAQLDYLQGKYDEAAQGFQDAYAARQFPQFLYNVGAAFHMKGKKLNDAAAYGKAVDFYKQYIAADPQAADKAKVEKSIGVLEAEIKRLGSTPPDKVKDSGEEVKSLGDVKTRGLVVVESEPANATIYHDDKKKGPFATTPWSGSLDGEHKIIIEKKGYKISESTLSADPSKLFVLRAVMSEEGYLGWVDITSNVPGADIFLDDKSVGAIAHTPLSQNFKPGKHTFYISAEGYSEYKQDIEILPGQTYTVKADLHGAPVGKLDVLGLGIEDARILVDGQLLCERGPCIKSVPQGDHTISVDRPDYKPYQRRVTIQPKTETSIKVALSPKPGRSDAVVAYVLGAVFIGGGTYLGLQANKLHDDIAKVIAAGNPPVDSNDPRFDRGKIYAIAADAAFVVGGITLLTAVYYTFRDKGAPTTGLIDVRALALQPQVGPNYAGLGMGGHF
jgi:tetratricopeptide (TPR) repeat protein